MKLSSAARAAGSGVATGNNQALKVIKEAPGLRYAGRKPSPGDVAKLSPNHKADQGAAAGQAPGLLAEPHFKAQGRETYSARDQSQQRPETSSESKTCSCFSSGICWDNPARIHGPGSKMGDLHGPWSCQGTKYTWSSLGLTAGRVLCNQRMHTSDFIEENRSMHVK